ncbi:bifunctional diguanylate cyclase/phosphodiesterase [Phyllobacterium brassicacearum]|uniref:Bifunctional diguanylate cyclase/phosphodiesterase n=1 Tax=Phyllobacterium brassicacearum TaxID=314235 RepID=A0A2P7B740_9HYPH|nr:EAL domain-containing protein [Phyllobacterium brassicacearum]PSH62294.1 bifunctional diguanylate cyclase/phosphodiesterase [Phyllobacterium brassicacearum]TDQ16721.1 periplasmic sensor diguanylate cyclase/phosphodiesterase [Phyllobacterium brassicacearum]
MSETRPSFTTRKFLLRTALPVLATVIAICIAVSALVVWSSRETDKIAVARQESLLALVVSQAQLLIAHDQESSTVWDDAVLHVKLTDNEEWLNSNLGSWMSTYFGHDAAYVLNTNDDPIFAFADGKIADKSAYDAVRPTVEPLAAKLREMLRNPDPNGYGERVLSPGASEVLTLGGRPAIVSVKPIVSDTGNIEQTADETYLHVAIRYLDKSFITDLQRDYLFTGLRYSLENELGIDEHSYPLQSSLGQTIGYYIWQPYHPGSTVISQIAPAFAAIVLLMTAIVAALLVVLRLRSQKLQASEEHMNFLALHDSLTGLPNRAHFNDRLDKALSNVKVASLAVLYLDLDRFKQVNDTLGHPVGDELIRQFTARLKGVVENTGVIARLGGDEFTVIVPNAARLSAIETLCENIITAIRHPFDIDGNHIFIGVSIGVAVAPADGTERTELVRKADIALYHAKTAGRGQFAVFGKEMDTMLQQRRTLERELREALSSDTQIQVYYQPLYSARNAKITGVEALLRWRHPQHGWIAPDVFIPIAEDAGMIEALGERVLRQACLDSMSWPIETVAVNVSVVELRNPAYAMKVAKILLSIGMDPTRLELEVTESALTDSAGHCEHNIKALRALGITIALDDFGTGFSSLGRLQQLAVDRIKIDRCFVQGFGRSTNDEAIVRAIIDLAHAKGLRTTAEGVETTEQSDYLRGIGCDDLQGFLLSRPAPVKDIERLLRGSASHSAISTTG